jgi:ATP-dependent Clp protease ATP-binding subunit ClpX
MYELPALSNVEKVVIDEGMIEAAGQPLLIYSDQPKVAASK